MLAKELLEPIRPIAECLQGRLQEVYFGFQKVSEVKQHYQALREDVDKEHDRIHQKALLLTKKLVEKREYHASFLEGKADQILKFNHLKIIGELLSPYCS